LDVLNWVTFQRRVTPLIGCKHLIIQTRTLSYTEFLQRIQNSILFLPPNSKQHIGCPIKAHPYDQITHRVGLSSGCFVWVFNFGTPCIFPFSLIQNNVGLDLLDVGLQTLRTDLQGELARVMGNWKPYGRMI